MAILERTKNLLDQSLGRSAGPLAGLLKPFLKSKETMKIADYLEARLVAFLDVAGRDEAIDALIALAEKAGKLPNPAQFRAAILHREQLVSTGIGMGVAIPHAKLSELSDFFIAIGIQRKKGIEWNALDKAPVRIIILIGGPDNEQSQYLKLLSKLTSAIKDMNLRKEILQLETAEDVVAFFSKSAH